MQVTIGERIEDLIKENGLNNKQVADAIHLNPSQISNLINGKTTNPSSTTIINLAKYFNVSSDYLLGLSEYRNFENTNIGNQIGLTNKNIEYLKWYYNDSVKYENGTTMKAINDLISEMFDNSLMSRVSFINKLIVSMPKTNSIYDDMALTLHCKHTVDKILKGILSTMKDIVINISDYERIDTEYKRLFSQWIRKYKMADREKFKEIYILCGDAFKKMPGMNEFIEEFRQAYKVEME